MFRVADRALVRWHTYLLVAMGLFCMIAIIVVCLFSRRPVGILFRRQKVRFWNSVERWRPRSAGAVVRIRAGHARSQTALDDPNRPRRGGGTRGVARETVGKFRRVSRPDCRDSIVSECETAVMGLDERASRMAFQHTIDRSRRRFFAGQDWRRDALSHPKMVSTRQARSTSR